MSVFIIFDSSNNNKSQTYQITVNKGYFQMIAVNVAENESHKTYILISIKVLIYKIY